MRSPLHWICFLLLGALVSCQKTENSLPNIVLIVADDLGWKDVGFMGSAFYETPHLDRLAREGLVFDQAYAAAANCAPSRACLMTGLQTTAHGIYTVGSSERGDARLRRIIPADNTTSLRSSFHTLAEFLSEKGFRTASMGKWHLGEDPCSQGFELNIGGNERGHPGSYFAPYNGPDLQAPEGEYLTDRLTREALDFVKEGSQEPFFLYLPYYAVHTPLQAKDSLVKKYLRKDSRNCQSHATYAGMIDNLDYCIGLLLGELERSGLRDKTLVVFTSDNGGIRDISCQDPLRAGKGSYYEGGIRIPLVFSWPGHIEPGRQADGPVSHLDLFPTLMEVCGIHAPDTLDGISLWPLLTGEGDLPERPLFFHFPVYLQAYKPGLDDGRDPLFRTRPGSVIRRGDWKLHYYYEDEGCELYDLKSDPGERKNLAAEYPAMRDEMLGMLRSWLEEQGAQVDFAPNPAFDPEYLSELEARYY